MRIKHQRTGTVHQASEVLCQGELTPICPTNAQGVFQETEEVITCKVCFQRTEDQRARAIVAVCELWAYKEGLHSPDCWRNTLDYLVFRLPPKGSSIECLQDAMEANIVALKDAVDARRRRRNDRAAQRDRGKTNPSTR